MLHLVRRRYAYSRFSPCDADAVSPVFCGRRWLDGAAISDQIDMISRRKRRRVKAPANLPR